jgi:hypothetical protein
MRRLWIPLMVWLAACGGEGPPTVYEATSLEGHVRAELTTDPDPLAVGTSTLEVALTNEAGQPFTGVELELELTRTGTRVIELATRVEEEADGHYRLFAVPFSEPGEWLFIMHTTQLDRGLHDHILMNLQVR